MPGLVLGPLLRYVGETEATVWMETDAPCVATVLGHEAPSFEACGHHYAFIHVQDLEPGTRHLYEVHLDGECVWPEPGSPYPPSAVQTLGGDGPLRIAFGSCRVSLPHEPPYTETKDDDPRGRELDALFALVHRMLGQEPDEWPDLLLLLGDQVYADEVSPQVRAFASSRRDLTEPPGEGVADFEEYTRLYWEAWGPPPVRWLLSTVPSAMIFDDHDVHDDWNTSREWVETMRAEPWWSERIAGAFMSYWLYQHLGNLSPSELARDKLLDEVRESPDPTRVLREFAARADRTYEGTRWSFCRDLGGTRLLVMDSRAGRVLEDGRRCMVDEEEWGWIVEHASGDFDHLLLATSLPFLLAPGMHHLEAWNEAVCDGAWGGAAARLGERIRRGLDLEHWASFGESFKRVSRLIRSVGAGERGPAPATIVALSGDVHHAYLAEVAFPRGSRVESAVYQATCSPIRNPLNARERTLMRFGASRVAEAISRALAGAAGVERPEIRWRMTGRPSFDNQLALLDIEGRKARLRIQKAVPGRTVEPELTTTFERRLA